MRFSLQDVKKSIQRRAGELSVSLHFLRPGELDEAIELLVAYHEGLLGQPQREFAQDTARSYVGDYRLANCLIATLSHWYVWRQRGWGDVVQTLAAAPELRELASAAHLRFALYNYVNEHYQGFLDAARRTEALTAFAAIYHISVTELEALLVLDSEEEALLVRDAPEAPTAQEVATLYNQWVFEAALFNASDVHFVIDYQAFAGVQRGEQGESGGRKGSPVQWTNEPIVTTGIGAVIKRLCYLARKMGVYYDLAYEASGAAAPLLHLTLYGPQEVTGAPQYYGMRLARLCRLLLNYGVAKTYSGERENVDGTVGRRQTKKSQKATLGGAVIEAEATVHFLQRAYQFVMDARLLQLLPQAEAETRTNTANTETSVLFDSSIEQAFSEAFSALASSQGVDGWRLEREPEPLLLNESIFIPDFAVTRDQQRIYVEILGFWTPAYRERKIQKLQQLQGRRDLLLAIPEEAREAFAAIASSFPIVYYDGQLSATDVLQALRRHYDDFAERLAAIDIAHVCELVSRSGLLGERACYAALHCYRRSELAAAAVCIVDDDIQFVPGLGLYRRDWLERWQRAFLEWMRSRRSASLHDIAKEVRERWPELADCDEAAIEVLLNIFPGVRIRRDSIFDIVVEVVDDRQEEQREQDEEQTVMAEPEPEKKTKKVLRERRPAMKKRSASEGETVQGDLWGM